MPRKRKLPDGMVERPRRKGYYADFRVGGRRVQKKLGTDFDAAKSKLAVLRARVEKADYGLLDNDYLLADLRTAYLKRCAQELRPKSVDRYRRGLEDILGFLNVVNVRQITQPLILAYREDRLKHRPNQKRQRGPGTVNHHVGLLVSMLEWAVSKKLIGSNPLAALQPLLHDRPKEGRALSDDEVARLLEKSPPHWRDVWYALLVTGMRRGELASLRFVDIDRESRELIIRSYRAKGKRERRVPIDDGLWDILERIRAEAPFRQPGQGAQPKVKAATLARFTKDHVFVSTQNTPLDLGPSLWEALMRCCDRAGIPTRTVDTEGWEVEHVDLHSLRRTFATNAIVNGADPNSVREILGHSSLAMTMKIYAKVKAAPKRQAVGKLSYAQGTTAPAHVLPMAANG